MRRIGPPVEELPDEVLLSDLGRGDQEVTVAFLRRFQGRVYGVALSVLGDPGLSEDVAQQVFERAWRNAGTYDPRRGSVTVWLNTIARNLAIDTARKRRFVAIDPAELLLQVLTSAESPERSVLAVLAADNLYRALRDLPVGQARAAVMAGVAGMSASQIAESEGIPLGTAKTRIRTAMRRLHVALSFSGGGHE
jgi:RNA polymerase sigma-70 factor (ECF subfamily)